ncbi:uncharacterized protein LOC144544751 isoform X3 [Carex rostrata]
MEPFTRTRKRALLTTLRCVGADADKQPKCVRWFACLALMRLSVICMIDTWYVTELNARLITGDGSSCLSPAQRKLRRLQVKAKASPDFIAFGTIPNKTETGCCDVS